MIRAKLQTSCPSTTCRNFSMILILLSITKLVDLLEKGKIRLVVFSVFLCCSFLLSGFVILYVVFHDHKKQIKRILTQDYLKEPKKSIKKLNNLIQPTHLRELSVNPVVCACGLALNNRMCQMWYIRCNRN